MSDDYAKSTAAPGFFEIGDDRYRAAKFTPRDIGDLNAFLKDRFPDPRLMIRELCEGLPDAVAIEIWKDLREEAKEWPPTVLSPEGSRELILTWDGNAHLAWVALRRHNKDVDLEAARQLTRDISVEKVSELFALGFPEETHDPKAGSTSKEVENPESP